MRRADFGAAACFAGLALVMSWPLARHLTSAIPGEPGDNLAFLWNFWWMREAIASGVSPFHTPYLFAPAGVDLTLNTHTALPAAVGATVFAPWGVIAAYNLTLLLVLALNGFSAYLLAGRVTSDRGARLAAGVVFAMSSAIAVRLLGHFNLTCAFVLPLFALAWLRALAGSIRAAVLAGFVMAATAFTDYYYLVFEIAIGVCLLLAAMARWSMTWQPPTRRTRTVARIMAGAAALALVAAIIIVLTGGVELRLGSSVVSMRTTYNPLQAFWICAAVAFAFWTRPAIAIGWRADWNWLRAAGAGAVAAAVFALAAGPILLGGARLLASGDYVSQRYFWRSAPGGVDLATMVLGNPLHPLWGRTVRLVYGRLGLDPVESVAWLGLVPVALSVVALRRCSSQPAVRLWLGIGAGFGVWALGPHLTVAGGNTGLILPEAVLRLVPLASNARIPGRAMAVVCLAVAMLVAAAIAHLRERAERPGLLLALCLAVITFEQMPAPLPSTTIETPRIYEVLRDRPEKGSVIELPMGVADGLGEVGAFDRRTFAYQMTYRRPVAGGFVARLPASVRRAYDGDPVLSALVALSDPEAKPIAAVPDRAEALERLRADGVQFVMLNRAAASPALVAYVDTVLPLARLADEGTRSLFVVSQP